MSRFTKALRQRIVKDFAIRHNGNYNPTLFFEEVRRTGKTHAAFDWFEWDEGKAALAYQVEQARGFARDLRVSFTVQVIDGGKRKVQVRETAMPLVLSPIAGRRDGGGYVLTDENDPSHMEEHCRQAALALRSWLNRYRAAADHVECSVVPIEDVVARLEAAAPVGAAAA